MSSQLKVDRLLAKSQRAAQALQQTSQHEKLIVQRLSAHFRLVVPTDSLKIQPLTFSQVCDLSQMPDCHRVVVRNQPDILAQCLLHSFPSVRIQRKAKNVSAVDRVWLVYQAPVAPVPSPVGAASPPTQDQLPTALLSGDAPLPNAAAPTNDLSTSGLQIQERLLQDAMMLDIEQHSRLRMSLCWTMTALCPRTSAHITGRHHAGH